MHVPNLQIVDDAKPAVPKGAGSQPEPPPLPVKAAAPALVLEDSAPQPRQAPIEAVRDVPEPQQPAPAAARGSEAATETAAEELAGAPQKQHMDMATSADIHVDTAAPGAQNREDEDREQGRQAEPSAAEPESAVQEQPAKEQAPKRKKGFSFLKRGRCERGTRLLKQLPYLGGNHIL